MSRIRGLAQYGPLTESLGSMYAVRRVPAGLWVTMSVLRRVVIQIPDRTNPTAPTIIRITRPFRC